MNAEHRAEIIRQFTLQARSFGDLAAHSTDLALSLFVEIGDIDRAHDVLDAGCGPGLLATYLAPCARHVTGTDVTLAMIEASRARAAAAGLANLTFCEGDMLALPFRDGTFDRTCTRFTFHHVPEVLRAFAELVRVTRPGGRVVLMDAAPPASKRDAYDHAETLRDPSHFRALTLEELLALGETEGLGTARVRRFGLPVELESQLAASFPGPGGSERLRALFADDVGHDRLGFGARLDASRGDAMVITFPIAVLSWTKGA
jgi:SAM-dependent methyltransferase